MFEPTEDEQFNESLARFLAEDPAARACYGFHTGAPEHQNLESLAACYCDGPDNLREAQSSEDSPDGSSGPSSTPPGYVRVSAAEVARLKRQAAEGRAARIELAAMGKTDPEAEYRAVATALGFPPRTDGVSYPSTLTISSISVTRFTPSGSRCDEAEAVHPSAGRARRRAQTGDSRSGARRGRPRGRAGTA